MAKYNSIMGMFGSTQNSKKAQNQLIIDAQARNLQLVIEALGQQLRSQAPGTQDFSVQQDSPRNLSLSTQLKEGQANVLSEWDDDRLCHVVTRAKGVNYVGSIYEGLHYVLKSRHIKCQRINMTKSVATSFTKA